jgi:hypothetical protein
MRQTQKRLAFAVCGALLLASVGACGGGGGSETPPNAGDPAPLTIPQKIAQLENTGALPKLDRSADIKGPDANGNGIRDDLDTLIQNTYTQPAQLKAAEQYAVVAQAQLLVDTNDKAAVKALAVRSARAINCLIQQFGTTQAPRFSDVQALVASDTTDTKARMQAQLAYSKALDGTVVSLPEGNTCE